MVLWLVAHGQILSLSLSAHHSLSALTLDAQICAKVPLVSGIHRFPHRTNELARSSPLWNCLSLGAICRGLGAGPLIAFEVRFYS